MKKIIKSQREIGKKWETLFDGVTETIDYYKEYDINGNLVLARNNIPDPDSDIADMPLSNIYNDTVTYKYDECGRLLEKRTNHPSYSIIEKYTYNAQGRELSYNRIGKTGDEYHFDFSYETDDKGRLWKKGTIDNELLVFQVLDGTGKILYDTEMTFPDENYDDEDDNSYNDIFYNHYIYKYDEQERIIDKYSFNTIYYTGSNLHTDFLEDNGIKITNIIERDVYPNIDDQTTVLELLENLDLLEIEEADSMISRKETIRQWEDKRSKMTEIKDELTGKESNRVDYLDDENKVYKTTIYHLDENHERESLSIFLFNKNGDRVDEKVFNGPSNQLVLHTVSYYSEEDGRILFSSQSFCNKNQTDEILYWYEYTFFD